MRLNFNLVYKKRHRIPQYLFFIGLLSLAQFTTYAQTTLFPFGSSWKYKDGGTSIGTTWKGTGFDDSGWSSGIGKLGYGQSGLSTTLNACPSTPCNSSNRYLSYYFRNTFTITDVSIYEYFTFEMYRDDGIIVYVNGVEVIRNNMPAGTIVNTTLATSSATDNGTEIITVSLTLLASQFQTGVNTIAVEVHQSSNTSSDLIFDMQLKGYEPGYSEVTMGPYLQKATSTTMTVRWYTFSAVDSKVTYGTSLGNLTQSVVVSGSSTSHSVTLTGLTPYTKYYYSVGSSSAISQSGPDNYFLTSPLSGTNSRYTFWVTGDVGNNSTNQRNVRDRFNTYIGSSIINGWLLLGDNAYDAGAIGDYTSNFFQIYPTTPKHAPIWPATGNHEYNDDNNRQIDHNIDYFNIFDLPTNGEAGGVVSNSEAYYSFDYDNIHFVALDSYIIETVGSNQYRMYDVSAPQVAWLKLDLAANTKKWTIVYFHHPPYTMGSHNSDTDTELKSIRQNIAPIFEQYNVDLVLCGHSHGYERSGLMKGNFGLENTFNVATHNLSTASGKYDGVGNSCLYVKNLPGGTVYTVAGSAGQLGGSQGSYPHAAMYYSNVSDGGSLILEIEDNRLDSKWLTTTGVIQDQFTIMKDVNKVTNITLPAGQSATLQASWVGQYDWSHSSETTRSVSITPASSVIINVTDQFGCITDTFNITVDPLPVELISFIGRADNEKVTLNWTTASELNNDFFEVQRFINPEQVKTVGKIAGHGTTPESHDYLFEDLSPLGGVAYYRLKQVDYDGKYEYSNVIRVEFEGSRSVKLFPNPGDGRELRLSMELDEGPLSISVSDTRGVKVAAFFIDSISDTMSSSNVRVINFDSPLSPGMYFVQIKSNSGITTHKWLVK